MNNKIPELDKEIQKKEIFFENNISPYCRELFISYDEDMDDALEMHELYKFFNAIDYPMTIAIYWDLARFGDNYKCRVSWNNLMNLWFPNEPDETT